MNTSVQPSETKTKALWAARGLIYPPSCISCVDIFSTFIYIFLSPKKKKRRATQTATVESSKGAIGYGLEWDFIEEGYKEGALLPAREGPVEKVTSLLHEHEGEDCVRSDFFLLWQKKIKC